MFYDSLTFSTKVLGLSFSTFEVCHLQFKVDFSLFFLEHSEDIGNSSDRL